MTVTEGVRARLLAVSAVTAIVVQEVYSIVLPQNVAGPAIRVQRVSEDEVVHLRGVGKMKRARVQVDSVATSAAGALALDAAVHGDGAGSGLLGFQGLVSGTFRIHAVLPAGVREEYEGGTVNLFKVMRDVFVTFQEVA